MNEDVGSDSLSRRELLEATALGGVAGMTGLAGCTGSGPGESEGTSGGGDGNGQLTILHGWCGGDGEKAITTMLDGYESATESTNVDGSGVCGGGNTNLNAVVSKRVQNQNYPSTWADWPGKNLIQFTDSDILGDIGDSVWSENNMEDAYLELTKQAAKPDGTYVAVPINIHRINNLFYNVSVFEEAGVDPTSLSSPSDLLEASETIATETDAVPFAHSTKSPWTSLDLFEVLLLAEHGPSSYSAFTNGEADPATVESTLDLVSEFEQYYPGDSATISWTEGNQKVMNGEAAYIVQGDWAAGAYRGSDDFEYESDWNHVPFPGSEGYYALNMDSFTFPEPNTTPERTKQFLRYCGTKDAQKKFNRWKGSIPPREDVSMDDFPAFQQSQAEDFRSADEQIPSITHGLAVRPEVLSELDTAMGNFVGNYDTGDATEQFQGAVQG